MKKKFILMLTLLAGGLSANADNVISVSSADVMQGSTGVISIDLNNTDVIASFQLDVTLPDGFSFALRDEPVIDDITGDQKVDGEGNPVFEKVIDAVTTTRTANHEINSNQSGQTATFIVASMGGKNVIGTSGAILNVKITSDGSQDIGDKFPASVSNIVLSKQGAIKENISNADFNITVIENRIVLDEKSTTAPEKATGVNVKVKRTINANEWSTICLPFAMDEVQVKAAFGNGVLLKDFSSWSSEEDDEGDIVEIKIGFNDVTAIEANHPYLIKVGSNITEFDVDGVDIDPDDEPEKVVGKKKAEKGTFTGVYEAETILEEGSLFLNGNKLYYSDGLTKIKAFRGYFTFADELANKIIGARSIEIDVDGTTGINNAIRELPNDGNYYNLKGQRVETPSKGVYILNGKKVVVK